MKIENVKKSGERIATKVLIIISLMLAIGCTIAGIALLAVYADKLSYYSKPISQSVRRMLSGYLIPGAICLAVGACWIPLEIVSLKAIYVSNNFKLMVGLAIPHILTGVAIPVAVMMMLVAWLECKKTKSSL